MRSLLLATRFVSTAFTISTIARIALATCTNLRTSTLTRVAVAGIAFAIIGDTTLTRVTRASITVSTGLAVTGRSSTTLAERLTFARVARASSSKFLLNLDIHLDDFVFFNALFEICCLLFLFICLKL